VAVVDFTFPDAFHQCWKYHMKTP